MQSLTHLYIYPIKSTKGIELPQTLVEEKGLKDDRRYMLVDDQGQFITGRTHPQLTQVNIEFSKKGLLVSAPGHPSFYIQPECFSEETLMVGIWDDNVEAQHCHSDYDQWFSHFLKQQCKLVYFSESSARCVKNKQTQVGFADGYPLLLINQASVNHLNTHLEKPVTALHFRPNIIIDTGEAFAEDNWARIKIGEIEFEVSKPCSRCNFTNVDPKTGIADLEQPLKTLAQFRFNAAKGDIDFGQNLIPLNSGVIRNGDQVQVLETQSAPVYDSMLEEKSTATNPLEINFTQSQVRVTGNDQQVLLEQAEDAGINIPYSCRGGKCGRCKIKLIDGEVKVLNEQGLFKEEKEAGFILACSCIPLTDISIEH